MTLQPQAFSRLRCWTGLTMASTTATTISRVFTIAPSVSTLPLPISVAGLGFARGTSAACATSRSMAPASATASSSRASGVRSASRSGRSGRLGTGWMTRDRPVDRTCPAGAKAIDLLFFALFAGLEELHRLRRHHGRDRVLVDQLRMRVAPQQHAEVVEPGDDALQLHAVYQEDGDRHFVLADVVQEDVLDALGFLVGHYYLRPLFLGPPVLGPGSPAMAVRG